MDTFQLVIVVSLVLSAFFIWRNPGQMLLTKCITLFHFLLLILTIAVLILLFNNYKLLGVYSNTIVGVTFLSSGIILFGFTKNRIVKIYSGIIFSVNLLFQLALLFAPNGLLLLYAIAYFIFQPPYMTRRLTSEKRIEFYEPFMGPPPIFLAEKKMGILKTQKVLLFKNDKTYYKPNITELKMLNDTTIECSILIDKVIIKDTLISQ